jgi:sulfur-carrier protein
MAHVTLVGYLRQYADGIAEHDIDAKSIKHLFAILSERYPALAPLLENGMAVAIDGEIYQEALFQPIGDNAEVHILPAIPGG